MDMNKCNYLLTVALLACIACTETKDNDVIPEPDHALDHFGKALVQVEQFTNELEFISRASLAGKPELFGACATIVTGTDGGFTTYDVAFTNTTCADDKVRDGVLLIAVNPENQNVIIQTTSLITDGIKFEGVYLFTPVTENAVNYTGLVVNGGKITAASGNWFSFTSTKKYQWKEGTGTAEIQDDVLEISSGEYFMTLQDHGLCQLEIESPLRIHYSCDQRELLPVSGRVMVESLQTTTHVNFGNGQCTGIPTQQ